MTNTKAFAAAALATLLSTGVMMASVAHAADATSTSSVKEKHACKGQNSCKGNGGDGKNACKGKGSCATDGSK